MWELGFKAKYYKALFKKYFYDAKDEKSISFVNRH